MQEVGACLISHWPFNSRSSGRIFDQHKHGLWAPKGQSMRRRKREREKERKEIEIERYRCKEREKGFSVL